MKKIHYLEVPAEERLPKRKGIYITKVGDGCDFCWQDTVFEKGKWLGMGTDKVFVWLEKSVYVYKKPKGLSKQYFKESETDEFGRRIID